MIEAIGTLVTAGLRTIKTLPGSALRHSEGRAPRIALVLRKIYFRGPIAGCQPPIKTVAGRRTPGRLPSKHGTRGLLGAHQGAARPVEEVRAWPSWSRSTADRRWKVPTGSSASRNG